MSEVDQYVEVVDSFVDDVIEWRADVSSAPSEFGADFVSATAVNFMGHTLDLLESAGELLKADNQGLGVSQVEGVIQDYNEARFNQMTTWYEHMTAVNNVESELSESEKDYHIIAETIQESMWDALEITGNVHEGVSETAYAERVKQNYEHIESEDRDTVELIERVEGVYDDVVSFQEGLELVNEEGNPVS